MSQLQCRDYLSKYRLRYFFIFNENNNVKEKKNKTKLNFSSQASRVRSILRHVKRFYRRRVG